MQTIGLHIGAGIDAMVSEPTPIGDRVQERILSRADPRGIAVGLSLAELKAEIEKRLAVARRDPFRRVLAWLGLVDD